MNKARKKSEERELERARSSSHFWGRRLAPVPTRDGQRRGSWVAAGAAEQAPSAERLPIVPR